MVAIISQDMKIGVPEAREKKGGLWERYPDRLLHARVLPAAAAYQCVHGNRVKPTTGHLNILEYVHGPPGARRFLPISNPFILLYLSLSLSLTPSSLFVIFFLACP